MVNHIKNLLFIALAYFLLGKLGLLLAIPPGYASPLFPPAAVGVVAVLTLGNRALVGVWLGSFLINLDVNSDWIHGHITVSQAWLAACLAIGPCLQSWLAGTLVRWRIKNAWKSLDHTRDIIAFLILSGPIASLMACSWGMLILFKSNIVSAVELPFNWWNWWVGDCIGVLLFAPMFINWLFRHEPLWNSRLKGIVVPVLFLIAAIVTSFFYVANQDSKLLKYQIAEHGQTLSHLITQQLNAYHEVVTALASLMTINPQLGISDFSRYSQAFLDQHPDIQALSWNPKITANQRQAFERRIGSEHGLANFTITERDSKNQLRPAQSRDWYVPVGYICPVQNNIKALGYDIASNKERLTTIELATKTRKLLATPPIRLVQDTSNQAGLLLMQPVFASTHLNDDAPIGFAVGVFKVEEALEHQIRHYFPPQLGVVVEELGNTSDQYLFATKQLAATAQLDYLIWNRTIDFAGRQWRISVYPTKEYVVAYRSMLDWYVLAIGMVIASLLQAMLLTVSGRSYALKQSLQRIQKTEFALERVGIGIAFFDSQTGRFMDVNEETCHQLGYQREELLGLTLCNINHNPSPETFQRMVANMRATGNDLKVETIHYRKDGSSLNVAVNAFLNTDQEQEWAIAFFQDISERKQIEQRNQQLLAILNESTDFVSTSTMDAQILYLNPAGYAMLGMPPDMPIEQMHVEDFHPAWAYAKLQKEAIPTLIKQGNWQGESALLHRDGHEIPVYQNILLHRDAQGQPSHISSYMRDITRLKADERALFEAKEAAEAANLAKSAFLANMSHEIRTPLNAISGMAYMIRRDSLKPEQMEQLDKMENASNHLLNIINDILELSKIEAEKCSLEEIPVRIEQLIGNVMSIVNTQAKAKSLDLRMEIAPIGYGLLGDPTRIQQALLNYASNAVKFTKTGSVAIRAYPIEEDADRVLIQFEVEDTGVGIAPDALARLFSAFEQADNTITRQYGGTGLGLAITKKLSQLMGGDVGINSELGKGSRFWFTARLKKTDVARPHIDTQSAEIEYTASPIKLNNIKVLLVEDEPINREIGSAMLKDMGFSVDTAEDGVIAVQQAQTTQYDLILMDMQMPNMDGLTATRQIRAFEHHALTPILAITANAFAEDRQLCFEAGMNDFTTKPIKQDELRTQLHHWLTREPKSVSR